MHHLSRLYASLLTGMAVIAGVMLVWLMVAIVISVGLRNLGLQPPAWLFLSTEYSMFYLTLLGAPWLVRQKGHVQIELLTAALPHAVLPAFSRLVALGCVVVCAILAWKGLDLLLMNWQRSDYDVRAFFVPKWILTVAFPVSFGLMAVEFARFVVGPDTLHSGEAGIKE
ncbi:TRAP transporter small permease [Roseospira goensis]|uniref:TRAP transporter small permease protein n=1 Tax=Roseospira goensis TaxID=391922 RepID=A0A7W6S2W4_9PROT|nr:TRAP transporter small permease [Roseospira goensis]MBB4287901.1 TRAP-type C4-dicarboxylate transport system permease small subunit [Roseospira goensis]